MLPEYLSESDLHQIIKSALSEDLGDGDVTTRATIPEHSKATAHFVAKETGILAGLLVAEYTFRHLNPSLDLSWSRSEGEIVRKGEVFGTLEGEAYAILGAERVALNFLQRMSGIASATQKLVEAVRTFNTAILDTRKTAPGLRLLDKWAVLIGGGENHRLGLYDQILIKDNHIAAAGGISRAIHTANQFRKTHQPSLLIEIETTTLDEVEQVLTVGEIDTILLDNMTVIADDGSLDTSMLEQAVRTIGRRFGTEASGNVTLETISAIAATGVDAISSGALTHSVRALDISLKIQLES